MLNHDLNQCWGYVNWNLRNKLQWNFYLNTKLFIHKNASENTICEMTSIFSRGRWVKLWCSTYLTEVLYAISCYIIGIDHDTVCAGVVGTAIRHSKCCAGRRVAAPAGTMSAVPDCSTNHNSADLISGQFLFYHDHNFTKSKGNLRLRRLVPLFVPIGVCITTHEDGTANYVTIGMWRHNQQATNHERNGNPWFSLSK